MACGQTLLRLRASSQACHMSAPSASTISSVKSFLGVQVEISTWPFSGNVFSFFKPLFLKQLSQGLGQSLQQVVSQPISRVVCLPLVSL